MSYMESYPIEGKQKIIHNPSWLNNKMGVEPIHNSVYKGFSESGVRKSNIDIEYYEKYLGKGQVNPNLPIEVLNKQVESHRMGGHLTNDWQSSFVALIGLVVVVLVGRWVYNLFRKDRRGGCSCCGGSSCTCCQHKEEENSKKGEK